MAALGYLKSPPAALALFTLEASAPTPVTLFPFPWFASASRIDLTSPLVTSTGECEHARTQRKESTSLPSYHHQATRTHQLTRIHTRVLRGREKKNSILGSIQQYPTNIQREKKSPFAVSINLCSFIFHVLVFILRPCLGRLTLARSCPSSSSSTRPSLALTWRPYVNRRTHL